MALEPAASAASRQDSLRNLDPERGVPVVAIVGNPNVGKTALYNHLSRENARVGNYPGVTVERRVARVVLEPNPKPTTSPSGETDARRAAPLSVELVDVPGTYSLSARSLEEQIAINAVLGFGGNPEPALALLVIDAGQLTRNLYLALQLLELEVPLVVALNMLDEVQHNPPDVRAVSELLGVPVVATDARRGRGIQELKSQLRESLLTAEASGKQRRKRRVTYPEALEANVAEVRSYLPKLWQGSEERERALALWALSSLSEDDELEGIEPELRKICLAIHARSPERDIDADVIQARYAFLDQHVPGVFPRKTEHHGKRKATERLDRILLHPALGFLIFAALMFVIFQSLFAWADPAIGVVEDAFAGLQNLVTEHFSEGTARDLVTEGVIGGVGNVLVFLPQILLLFFFIGLLEDTGYMARVAFLMDRVMRSLGLHGRAFVPMLSGFACAVPAVLATRTMERQRDRLLTMLVVPLMTCSARLPVYTLVIGTLFPPSSALGLPVQGLLMVAMYVFAISITLVAAAVLGRTVVKGRRIPLILELPPYRVPSLGAVLKMMWERSTLFVKEAGTVILLCTVVLWALLSFPKVPSPLSATPPSAAPQATAQTASPSQKAPSAPPELSPIEHSYGARLGKAIEPVIAPLGFDWKIGVGIIGAFAAREVFVSTMGLVYGIGDADESATPLRDKLRAEARPDGKPAYTPLTGLSLLIFFAIACQCVSTLAVVKRETKSFRWPAFLFGYMTVLAYVLSLAVYQGGKLLGF